MKSNEKFWLTTEEYSETMNEHLMDEQKWEFCELSGFFIKQIQFECEKVPMGYELMFVSNNRELIDTYDGISGVSLIRREIIKGKTGNRYAYFGKRFNTLTFQIEGI